MDTPTEPGSGTASHDKDRIQDSDQHEIKQHDGGGEENESKSSDHDGQQGQQTTPTPTSVRDALGVLANEVRKLAKLMNDISLHTATEEPEGQVPTGEGWYLKALTDDSGASDGELHTTTFNLNDYKCHSPPRFLYRTVHPGSHSTKCSDGSHSAGGPKPKIDNLDDFRDTVGDHFIWGRQRRSPYMSTFSTLDRLKAWAELLERNNHYQENRICFLMIDTWRLSDGFIFDAQQLATRLDIVTVYGPYNTIVKHDCEFLIKDLIDAKAIVAEGTLENYATFSGKAERITTGSVFVNEDD